MSPRHIAIIPRVLTKTNSKLRSAAAYQQMARSHIAAMDNGQRDDTIIVVDDKYDDTIQQELTAVMAGGTALTVVKYSSFVEKATCQM